MQLQRMLYEEYVKILKAIFQENIKIVLKLKDLNKT
jgi:ribosomal protein S17E